MIDTPENDDNDFDKAFKEYQSPPPWNAPMYHLHLTITEKISKTSSNSADVTR